MAEYMVADSDATVALPGDVPFEQAASLMCAGVRIATVSDEV